jgi:hypothetical protein
LRVKLQADQDLDRSIVRGLLRRQSQVDFRAAPLEGIDDLAVLGLAAADERILVSHDVSTMPTAFRQFRQSARSPGVLLVPQGWPLEQTIQNLLLIWELSEAAEWENRICYLPTLAEFLA